VLAELRAVPTTKVTVAKEVVRLLGELGGPEAFDELLALDRPGTHRDVRIALLRALWDHLDSPRTWEVFERAVNDPDWIVASKLTDIPLGRLSDEAETRVVKLLSNLLARPEPEARLHLLNRAAQLPLRDRDRALFQRLLAHVGVDATDEAATALSAALQRMLPAEVGEVSRRLTQLVRRRKLIAALLPHVARRLGTYQQAHHEQVARALLEALRTDPATIPLYLTLGTRLWDWRQLVAALVELASRDLLYHDAMDAAFAAARACIHWDHLDEALQKQADPRLRRVGLVALVNSAGLEKGWTKDRRERLDLYREDPSPGVSGPASFVFPP
jgi:hypothetical protein